MYEKVAVGILQVLSQAMPSFSFDRGWLNVKLSHHLSPRAGKKTRGFRNQKLYQISQPHLRTKLYQTAMNLL